MKRALLIMAKRPFAGRTKTRLCPPLSPEEAAVLYECFLLDTIAMARSVPRVTPFIACSPHHEEAYFRQLAPDFEMVSQEGQSLSERLDFVLTSVSEGGYDQVAAINSDSPTLPAGHVAGAFDRLDEDDVDVVLGPAEDGGYYLIGWKRPHPRLVRDVQMSTPQVLQDTMTIAETEGLRVALIPTWYDVDNVTTLKRAHSELSASSEVGRHTYQFLNRMPAW